MTTRFDRILGDDPKPPPQTPKAKTRKAKKAPEVETPPPPVNLTVREKIQAGEYRSKLPYPERLAADYRELRRAYQLDQARLDLQFKVDLIRENGVEGHPKADLCYSKAWDHGHSSGYSEVVTYFEDFVELLGD